MYIVFSLSNFVMPYLFLFTMHLIPVNLFIKVTYLKLVNMDAIKKLSKQKHLDVYRQLLNNKRKADGSEIQPSPPKKSKLEYLREYALSFERKRLQKSATPPPYEPPHPPHPPHLPPPTPPPPPPPTPLKMKLCHYSSDLLQS